MGRRLTQRILQCSLCNTTPENGEHLWEMGNEIWCEKCCNEQEEISKQEEEIKELYPDAYSVLGVVLSKKSLKK